MNRPTQLHVGGTFFWVLHTRNPDTMILKDADAVPTVAVRKNGASVADAVTVTKRAATTGIYDCSYNPAAEIEGDKFTLEETAAVTGTTTPAATYAASWNFVVVAVERGTDGANITVPDNASAAAAKVAAQSADGKLTAARLSRVDRLPDFIAGAAGGVALVGSEMGLTTAVITALFSDTDIAGLVNTIIARIESDLDGADVSVVAIATAVRNAILDRIVATNHEVAGSVGKLLQNLVNADAAVSGRATPAQVLAQITAGLDAISTTALARFATVDTGQVSAAAGSVAKLSQGAGGSGGLTAGQVAQIDRIESQTAKLSGTPVIVNGNVKPGGQIVVKHGDNHTVALGNAVTVPVDDVGGTLYGLLIAVGVVNLSVAAIRGSDPDSRIVGTVAALSYSSNVLTVTFEFTAAETSKGVVGPVYTYDVIRTNTPTRTYFSGKLTVTRDAR